MLLSSSGYEMEAACFADCGGMWHHIPGKAVLSPSPPPTIFNLECMMSSGFDKIRWPIMLQEVVQECR